ncbi:flagellar FliL protein [Alkalispirochaeta americana]|uniref:Flagellar protein FliL n=1 Tax=Alkalispirochaeta americana TaxID=159291 RepID=A0A1N6PLV7_9SPIO|nr:flagellar basal body-associated FliL family protein [Alkalispirochaeta americana]SIQ05368.1 flagellar FliL protein [Alkalispirochaeta americana]
MSDDLFDPEDESGGEDKPAAGKKKIGFLPAVVIDILKWSAIVIGAIVFIVVVVVITVRAMGGGARADTTRLPLHSEYERGGAEMLDWFSQIGDVRGTTRDEVRRTFIVTPHIGYRPESDATLQELIRREIQIREAVAIYFSSRSIRELEGVENRLRVKQDLREEINRIMVNRVRDVAFSRYEFIEF